MRIAVVLGGVLDPSGLSVSRRSGRLFVNREDYIIHPSDRCALEAALCLKDVIDAEVIALPRSAIHADDVLRQALARGADRAIKPTGFGFDEADDAVIAQVLAVVVRGLGGFDLILTGASTLDTRWMQLGGRLAQALDMPQILGAWSVGVGDGTLEATRMLDGVYQDVSCDLPAVVSVDAGSMRLRYPDGTRLINVYRSPDAIEEWPIEESISEDDLAPLLVHKGLEFPEERELGQRLEGPVENMARAISEQLRSRSLL